ncbi:MAG: DUF3795 domain-containing protein [Acidobacteriota bacterium]
MKGPRRGGSMARNDTTRSRPARRMSVCGVLCSECPAYLAASRGLAYQQRVADAWHRIYGLNEKPERISCGGCFGTDKEVFHTSRGCKARMCAHRKGLSSCAECFQVHCASLEKAQAVWDHVPQLSSVLSHGDFATYAEPYCGHRRRLASARARQHTLNHHR